MPETSEFVIRDGYVLTMDETGDLPGADVHVRGGRIHAVGKALAASSPRSTRRRSAARRRPP